MSRHTLDQFTQEQLISFSESPSNMRQRHKAPIQIPSYVPEEGSFCAKSFSVDGLIPRFLNPEVSIQEEEGRRTKRLQYWLEKIPPWRNFLPSKKSFFLCLLFVILCYAFVLYILPVILPPKQMEYTVTESGKKSWLPQPLETVEETNLILKVIHDNGSLPIDYSDRMQHLPGFPPYQSMESVPISLDILHMEMRKHGKTVGRDFVCAAELGVPLNVVWLVMRRGDGVDHMEEFLYEPEIEITEDVMRTAYPYKNIPFGKVYVTSGPAKGVVNYLSETGLRKKKVMGSLLKYVHMCSVFFQDIKIKKSVSW